MADFSLTPRRTKKVKYRKLTLTLAPCILHIKQKDSIVIEVLYPMRIGGISEKEYRLTKWKYTHISD